MGVERNYSGSPRGNLPLDELAARVDIVDVIGEHVHLKPAGKDLVGLCPFHNEKTPSFTVSPDKQLFYCFGCQTGGNVYTFLMKRQGLEFREAVEEVARRAGVDPEAFGFSEADREAWERRQRILAACAAAADYYRTALHEPIGAEARRYLRSRKLEGAAAEAFGLGYAPREEDGLLLALQAAGVSQKVAEEAGLLTRSREGRLRPRFRDRLMFPIRDVRGQVVGFGGRKLSEAGWGPKYLNSPQTMVFNKGELLFGLWEAREHIRRDGWALLVEGYTDVLALHGHGFRQAVATLGTAFAPEQARLLRRYCKEVVVAFDGDGAGERAALRSLDILSEAGLRVRVLSLPRGQDPDEYVRREGAKAMQARLESAVPLPEFRLRVALRGHRVDTVEGRARAVEAILPVLATVESAVELEGYVERLASALHTSPAALAADLERYRQRAAPPGAVAGRIGRVAGTSPHVFGKSALPGRYNRPGYRLAISGYNKRGARPIRAETVGRSAAAKPDWLPLIEARLVRRMLVSAGDTLKLLERLDGVGFEDPALRALVQVLHQRAVQNPSLPAEALCAPTGNREIDEVLARLLQEDAPDGEESAAYAARLAEYCLREQLRAVEGRLDGKAERGEDSKGGQDRDGLAEFDRLVSLLMEYHGVRRRLRREWQAQAASRSRAAGRVG